MAKQHLLDTLRGTRIPNYMWDGLVEYITEGRPTGSFLYAVLSNDLRGACNQADGANQHILYDYVFFLYNNAPAACWGSVPRVTKWMEMMQATKEAK
ncbi:MAG: hypothetical protein ACHQX3_01175 [Nitrospirales bacterium]